MKQYLFILFNLVFLNTINSQVAGTREITINECNFPILGISTNNASDKVVITASQGRVFCLKIKDIESSETINPIWKNTSISGFNLGGKPQFSIDDKYILLQESSALKTAINSRKVKDIKYCILNAVDGKVIIEDGGVNSAQFINNTNHILISTNKGLVIKDFTTNKVISELNIEDCEMAAINNEGNLIAVSYDPEKKDFKEVESIGSNKGELKNARKNKRLINFYTYPDFKKVYSSTEELDIIYSLKFSADSKHLYLLSHNVIAERLGTAGMNNMTVNAADSRRQTNIQVIDATNGVLLKEIYHATAEPDADFKLNKNYNVFGYSDNDGWVGWKRKLVLVDVFDHKNKVAQYRYQGKRGSSNIFPIYFSFNKFKPVTYLTNGTKLIEWNFEILKEYTDYVEGKNSDTLQIIAINQLNADLANPESYLSKKITEQTINGVYVFDITIQKKGQIVTIFAESDEKTDIPKQNALKDILLKYKFKDIEVAQNQRLKVRYTFNINTN
jgi:hypothetical protein